MARKEKPGRSPASGKANKACSTWIKKMDLDSGRLTVKAIVW
jgi:hypothetical protein